MTSGYGNEQQGIIELRQKIVEAVTYRGLLVERPSDTAAAAT